MICSLHYGFRPYKSKSGIESSGKGFVPAAGKIHAEFIQFQFPVFIIIGAAGNIEEIGPRSLFQVHLLCQASAALEGFFLIDLPQYGQGFIASDPLGHRSDKGRNRQGLDGSFFYPVDFSVFPVSFHFYSSLKKLLKIEVGRNLLCDGEPLPTPHFTAHILKA
jgi:hypothetical protein